MYKLANVSFAGIIVALVLTTNAQVFSQLPSKYHTGSTKSNTTYEAGQVKNISPRNVSENTSISVQPGWNLLSLPVEVADGRATVLFPGTKSKVFTYLGRYFASDTVTSGIGFWIKYDSAMVLGMAGDLRYNDTIAITQGWNMVGGLSNPVAVDSIHTQPDSILSPSFFSYTPGVGYKTADTLQAGRGYWAKAKSTGKLLLSSKLPMDLPCPGIPAVDYSGKTYHTVQIGTQCWLKENLDVGTMVDSTSDQTDNGMIEKYCYLNEPANCSTYGGFYQWNEAMQYSTTEGVQGICPGGWHIPTPGEVETLKSAVGGDGNALKAIGQGAGLGAGTNTSGFSLLLTGYRYSSGRYVGLGSFTFFWGSAQSTASNAYCMTLGYTNSVAYPYYDYKKHGFSVRCLKD
jgi:uncharacterized protein (TIGR02145 family)